MERTIKKKGIRRIIINRVQQQQQLIGAQRSSGRVFIIFLISLRLLLSRPSSPMHY